MYTRRLHLSFSFFWLYTLYETFEWARGMHRRREKRKRGGERITADLLRNANSSRIPRRKSLRWTKEWMRMKEGAGEGGGEKRREKRRGGGGGCSLSSSLSFLCLSFGIALGIGVVSEAESGEKTDRKKERKNAPYKPSRR